MSLASPSSVSFPLTESPQRQPKPAVRPPHLPFRRISLPTAPTLLHRESVMSVASFDSFPEGEDLAQPPRPPTREPKLKTSKNRPLSIESPRKRNRTRDSYTKSDDKLALKRRLVVDEFYETEKTYVDGLELIYNHFLSPIISSLDSPEPLLDRPALTSIFSNFIDIWNLHRSFFSALTTLLKPASIPTTSTSAKLSPSVPPPLLSPLLLAHFPYLSLYTPFVTSFPSSISALTDLIVPPTTSRPNPHYNARFASFLSTQEADPACAKLKLRDWLLSIVQRCPRYLLLLKDLINTTDKEDSEYAQLTAVHTLVSKITISLNTSLHTHSQTLALLALQKATPNLPFQLVTPGRNLIKRGALVQIERSDSPAEREFLLFSDCLVWLAPADQTSASWDWSWSGSASSGANANAQNTSVVGPGSDAERPPMLRTRSKSEAELPILKVSEGEEQSKAAKTPLTPVKTAYRSSHYHVGPPPPPSMAKRSPSDDKWIFKGKAELVDIDVVVGTALEEERRLEILSPEGSFAVYASSGQERDDWKSEIRAAKAQLLISLNVTNPNSTLTSSASTNHVRRALQALPYPPSDERLATIKMSSSVDVLSTAGSSKPSKSSKKEKEKGKKKRGISAERRRKVEHWIPAVWIPDAKTASCMRCGRMFGWRRRRHHCRLCGRCVCGACSGRTFFISESGSKDDSSSKPARACDSCYETVFPLIDPPDESLATNDALEDDMDEHNADTITSLSHLPSWLSMPALPIQPQALMAINLNSIRNHPNREVEAPESNFSGNEDKDRKAARIRVKSHQKLRSYQQILEDFHEANEAESVKRQTEGQSECEDADEEDDEGDSDVFSSPTHSAQPSPRRMQRREDTARRSKRFSLPAIALHTTNVTTRTATEGNGNGEGLAIPDSISFISSAGDVPSPARKRFSLVLGKNHNHADGEGVSVSSSAGISKHTSEDGGDLGLAKGIAAARLAELLRKAKAA